LVGSAHLSLLRYGCSTTFKVRRSKRYSHGKEE
jgi:hypothetical protein